MRHYPTKWVWFNDRWEDAWARVELACVGRQKLGTKLLALKTWLDFWGVRCCMCRRKATQAWGLHFISRDASTMVLGPLPLCDSKKCQDYICATRKGAYRRP